MKKKLLILLMVMIAIFAFAISASAATYYCDKDGNLVDAGDDNIAYEFDTSKATIPNIYLHDLTITKIVIPDIEEFTGQIQIQNGYTASLGVYGIDDKADKSNSLISQIKEVEIHESVYLDGAYTVGTFAGYTSLEKVSFYDKVGVASKGGFFQSCSKLNQLHFYGKNLAVPSVLINSVPYSNVVSIVFHESATGTISTGADTLPTVGNLGGRWTIVINENITPSNANDPRLGCKWGSYATTIGWELVLAVSNKNAYTDDQLEALKTSHGFASRFASVADATVKEATVKTYCELGLCPHDETTEYSYANGYINNGSKIIACKNGCGIENSEDLAPIFEFMGYSARTSGGSICLGYIVNKEALAFYEGVAGVSIDYGAVAIAPINEDELKPLYLDNGEVKAREYTISASVSGSYASFDFVLNGFNSEHYEVDLVMCAYVFDGSELSYLCIGEDENGSDTLIQSEIATTLKFSDYLITENA